MFVIEIFVAPFP